MKLTKNFIFLVMAVFFVLCVANSESYGDTYSDDINGTPRNGTWDIGAFEAPAAGGGASNSMIMGRFNK